MTEHDHDRDPVVRDALRRLVVADHGPGFWTDLERRLDLADHGEDGDELPRAERVVVPMVSVPPEAPPQDLRIATGELPAIPVHHHEAPTRRHTGRWLSIAAAVLVIASAVAITTMARNGDDDLAGAPTTTAAASTFGSAIQAPASSSVTAPSPSVPVDLEAPAAAVRDWVQAIGAGDAQQAAALLGPRTLSYFQANGIDPAGMMRESEEGIGGWATTPPPNTYLLDQRTITEDDGSGATDVAIVVIEGIWAGEGAREQRYDVYPVVDTPDGWRVEYQGYDPAIGGRVEYQTPAPGPDGLEPMSGSTGSIQNFFSSMGTVEYVLDGTVLAPRTTSLVGRPTPLPYAIVDMRDRPIAPGEHSLSIVFMSPSSIYVDGPVRLTVDE